MNERAKRSSAEYQYEKKTGGLTLWHTRKISAIRSVHRLCRADKNEKRKQNTVYISDKHRQVEYRLLCVHQNEGVGTAKNGLGRFRVWGVYSKLFFRKRYCR